MFYKLLMAGKLKGSVIRNLDGKYYIYNMETQKWDDFNADEYELPDGIYFYETKDLEESEAMNLIKKM